ncbi:MAG TPA: LemA family protein [Burkholderiales bacterium]|nr:LemA family protein [Burkholderiales bacterium]
MSAETLLAIIGLALILPAISLYNRIVAARNLARQAYADIEVQLKRRAELVPQLVEAVRAYAPHENALLDAVAELHAAALGAKSREERFAHERGLGERLKELVLLQESIPRLKADASFRKLVAQLVEIDDHLQFARRYYNGAVQQYLTRIGSFPDSVVAKLFFFRPMPFFEADTRGTTRIAL